MRHYKTQTYNDFYYYILVCVCDVSEYVLLKILLLIIMVLIL